MDGLVKNSVLFTGAKVAPGAKIIDSVLMPGVVVEEGAVVTRAIVADGVHIGKDAVVGSADSENQWCSGCGLLQAGGKRRSSNGQGVRNTVCCSHT